MTIRYFLALTLATSLFHAASTLATETRSYEFSPLDDWSYTISGGLSGGARFDLTGTFDLVLDWDSGVATIAGNNTTLRLRSLHGWDIWKNLDGTKFDFLELANAKGAIIDDHTVRFEQCFESDRVGAPVIDCPPGIYYPFEQFPVPIKRTLEFNLSRDGVGLRGSVRHLVGLLPNGGRTVVSDGGSATVYASAVSVPEPSSSISIFVALLGLSLRRKHVGR